MRKQRFIAKGRRRNQNQNPQHRVASFPQVSGQTGLNEILFWKGPLLNPTFSAQTRIFENIFVNSSELNLVNLLSTAPCCMHCQPSLLTRSHCGHVLLNILQQGDGYGPKKEAVSPRWSYNTRVHPQPRSRTGRRAIEELDYSLLEEVTAGLKCTVQWWLPTARNQESEDLM